MSYVSIIDALAYSGNENENGFEHQNFTIHTSFRCQISKTMEQLFIYWNYSSFVC